MPLQNTLLIVRVGLGFQTISRFIQKSGEVSEWLIEPVSKTGVPLAGTAGSNPALSVTGSQGVLILRAF